MAFLKVGHFCVGGRLSAFSSNTLRLSASYSWRLPSSWWCVATLMRMSYIRSLSEGLPSLSSAAPAPDELSVADGILCQGAGARLAALALGCGLACAEAFPPAPLPFPASGREAAPFPPGVLGGPFLEKGMRTGCLGNFLPQCMHVDSPLNSAVSAQRYAPH